jgi:hypothetical protein
VALEVDSELTVEEPKIKGLSVGWSRNM